MKKILFYAAAIAAMTACCDAAVDMITPEFESEGNALHEVTISANAPEGADSRAVIDDDADTWVVNWESGDALLAVESQSTSNQYTLTLQDGAGTSSATFSGSVGSNDYYLIYPATCGSQISGSNLAIDLTSQSEGGNSLYMISQNYIPSSDSNPSASMKQIGAVVDLTMTFPASRYNGATIESIEVSGFKSKGSVSINTKFSGASDLTASTITINDGVKTVGSDDKATVRFNILPTTFAVNDEVTVTAYVNNSGTVTPLTTTLTAGDEMDFARAKHHTIGCTLAEVSYSEYWTDEGIVATSFSDSSSDGSKDDPIEIYTAGELALIAKNVNASTTESYDGKYFKLMNDIDLTGYKWEAIGNDYSQPFMGNFDGNDKKITGLYVNESANLQGLFGIVSHVEIKGISVAGFVVGKNYVGGVVGEIYDSSDNTPTLIENCHNSCSVESVGSIATTEVGGVVGGTDTDNITIKDCSNSGSVKFTTSGSYEVRIGGVIGYANMNTTLIDCYNSGSVKNSSGTKVSSMISVGGVIGRIMSSSTITDCYNNGSVENARSTSDDILVGGVVGYANAGVTITNCYNSGSVTNSSSDSSWSIYLGGVVGQAYSASTLCTTLTNCYNSGSLTNSDSFTIIYFGGIVGKLTSTANGVTNCYNSGSLTNSGSGSTYVGGVAGYSFDNYISNCYYLTGTASASYWVGNTSSTTGETSDMTGTTFLETLNDNAKSINKATANTACEWITGTGGYPTLNFETYQN